jgi:hypothetical protein
LKPLYAFIHNTGINTIDAHGLATWVMPPSKPYYPPPQTKCCKQKTDASPYVKLADKFLTDLIDKVQEAEEAIGSSQTADTLKKLGLAKKVIDGVKSICDARNPDGCDDFLSSGDAVDCLLCCTSIHGLFSDELGGVGFLLTCKKACENAN